MRERRTADRSTVAIVVVAFWVGAAAGAVWLEYGFATQLFLYACLLAVGLAVFSLVMVWLWGAIFVDDPVRPLDEPKGRK